VSAPSIVGCPNDLGCEVAFAGRSNAGKSSAINTLTGIKGLARTSKTPGRTQLINFFQLDPEMRLVDLPGYGYAKVPRHIKENWGLKVSEYLQLRQSLAGLVLLMDIRHPLQKFDLQILTWAIHAGVPVHALLTKSDKVSKGKANNMLLNVDREFKHLDPTEELLTFQIFSSPKKVGVIDLKETLDHWFTSNFSLPTQNL
tara:strand:- start:438 stop:1037 length:600 start_codon:yes stop_codon:yes gene_type:complete